MEAAAEKKIPARALWCLCWIGEFSVQAEQTFRPPVQLVRLLYCYQLLGLEHIYIHLSAAVFRVDKGYDFTSVSQNNQPAATCHSNLSEIFLTMGAGSIKTQLSGREWDEILDQQAIPVTIYNTNCLWAKKTRTKKRKESKVNPAQATCCRSALHYLRQMTPHRRADVNAIGTIRATNRRDNISRRMFRLSRQGSSGNKVVTCLHEPIKSMKGASSALTRNTLLSVQASWEDKL